MTDKLSPISDDAVCARCEHDASCHRDDSSQIMHSCGIWLDYPKGILCGCPEFLPKPSPISDEELAAMREHFRIWGDDCEHYKNVPTILRIFTRLDLAAAALQTERDKVARLRKALNSLVKKLDEIFQHPAYKSVFSMAFVHGCQYSGPSCENELNDARQALEEEQP